LFSWLGFTSSSTDEGIQFPGNVLFTMNNKGGSSWRTRNDVKYSEYQNEKEQLYPAGAFFKVRSVEKRNQGTTTYYTAIMLDLIDVSSVNGVEKTHTEMTMKSLITFSVVYIVLGENNW